MHSLGNSPHTVNKSPRKEGDVMYERVRHSYYYHMKVWRIDSSISRFAGTGGWSPTGKVTKMQDNTHKRLYINMNWEWR